jgi:hypothetical protein
MSQGLYEAKAQLAFKRLLGLASTPGETAMVAMAEASEAYHAKRPSDALSAAERALKTGGLAPAQRAETRLIAALAAFGLKRHDEARRHYAEHQKDVESLPADHWARSWGKGLGAALDKLPPASTEDGGTR